MERLSDEAIEILNKLHRERLDYSSEYVPLMDAMNKLKAYEDTNLEPEEVAEASAGKPNGMWKRMEGTLRIVCSVCGGYSPVTLTKYCPNCGARMWGLL